MKNPIFTVRDLNLWYGQAQALKDITLNIPEKSITALVGISDRQEESCGQKCMRCKKTDCPFRAGN